MQKQKIVPRESVVHAIKTTIAALLGLIAARLVGLSEVYWAPISAMIVMQSTLGAALTVSWHRFAGTALGAAMGAILASYFNSNFIIFGTGIFSLGVLCAALRLDRAAYRYAGITLTIVMLVAHAESPWTMAFHRFAEVSIGIAVGVIVTALWPESKKTGTY